MKIYDLIVKKKLYVGWSLKKTIFSWKPLTAKIADSKKINMIWWLGFVIIMARK